MRIPQKHGRRADSVIYSEPTGRKDSSMENIIAERVKNAKLAKVQMKIAEYIIQNPERVGMSSSMEVAKAIGVSDTSVIRFARAIGYEGFTDLKNEIYNSMAAQAAGGISSLSLVDRYNSNQAEYGGEFSRTEYMKIVQYNLEKTFQRNSDDQFEQAVSFLLQAKHRYIVGFRGCLGIAGQCAWLLRLLLDHIISISDEGPGGVGSLQDIGAEDCAFFFSLSRYYKSDLKLARLAKERGAAVCLITDSPLSPLTDLSDVVLTAEIRSASFFNSTISMNMLSEYLVTKTAQTCEAEYRKRAAERDVLTADLRI